MARTKGAKTDIELMVQRHAQTIRIVREGLKKGKRMNDIINEHKLSRVTIYRLIKKGFINYEYKHKDKK